MTTAKVWSEISAAKKFLSFSHQEFGRQDLRGGDFGRQDFDGHAHPRSFRSPRCRWACAHQEFLAAKICLVEISASQNLLGEDFGRQDFDGHAHTAYVPFGAVSRMHGCIARTFMWFMPSFRSMSWCEVCLAKLYCIVTSLSWLLHRHSCPDGHTQLYTDPRSSRCIV
jgi:hypothetical protein